MKPGPKGPSKYDKNFHPKDFVERSKMGKNKTQIAAIWGVSRETIYEWADKYREFSDATKKGAVFLENWYIELGQSALMGRAKVNGKEIEIKNFNTGLYCWMTKNICKWSDKIENTISHSGELITGREREESMKKLFKSEKSKQLALELAEQLEAEHEQKLEKKNGQN